MADESARFCTKSAFSRLMGVAPSAVTFWKKRGWLVFDGTGQLIDIAASKESVGRNRNPGVGGKNGYDAGQTRGRPAEVLGDRPPSAIELATVADKDAARRLKELRIERETGRLIDAGAVLKAVKECAGEVAAGHAQMAALIGAEAAAKLGIEPRALIILIDGAVRKLNAKLVTKIEALAETLAA